MNYNKEIPRPNDKERSSYYYNSGSVLGKEIVVGKIWNRCSSINVNYNKNMELKYGIIELKFRNPPFFFACGGPQTPRWCPQGRRGEGHTERRTIIVKNVNVKLLLLFIFKVTLLLILLKFALLFKVALLSFKL